MRRLLLAFIGLLGLSGVAFGQATSVQQSASRLDSATAVAYATAAQGSQATATINVPGGQYAYITGVSLDTCANASGGTAIANGLFTSTNIQSTPSWAMSFLGTANTCAPAIRESYATPMKSNQAGVNVTVVSPAGSAQNLFGIRVYYYLAP
jgi:hypothetical protein